MQVALLQYPDGVFSFAHGDIDEVAGNDVHYHFGTAAGSSGSPLLNWAAEAVAMHKLGEEPRSATSTPSASLLSTVSTSSANLTTTHSPTPTPSPSQTPTQLQPDLQRTASLLSVVVEIYFRERPALISIPYVPPFAPAVAHYLLSVFRVNHTVNCMEYFDFYRQNAVYPYFYFRFSHFRFRLYMYNTYSTFIYSTPQVTS